MSVLIDTSVWVGHFRWRNETLVRLITSDQALTHSLVLLELACGTPPAPRSRTLHDIGLLRRAQQATPSEVMQFIETEQLYGRGCGSVDLTLLASALMTPGGSLWTLDHRLEKLARRFNVAFPKEMH
ncbi:Ribonuclease VapC32 [Paraburkholderia caffeinitolerans]|uniref:Ribonuclease VapC32 n=1 Tax=Paraburkholderia caffeinitolerans TaxID=1723730 RepID=A0A6J5GZF2_9BURK|nr:PIN domain-containing protein [Paraburkholderia caffeinitolerans]CAB3808043.1 Ribonuclease VapC32 [Paraburkholderia caffeinitolerans]